MDRGLFDLLADAPGGRDHLWAAIERERAQLAREREAAERERAQLVDTLTHEREAAAHERDTLTHEREAAAREREQLLDLAERDVENIQKKLDYANGLITVRGALEQIVTHEFPNKTATTALSCFFELPAFQEYLGAVSKATGYTTASLVKNGKEVYGALCQPLHGGSTRTSAGDAVPEAVISDKCTLVAVAAVFKFTRRNISFYRDGPAQPIKLPSPPRTPMRSTAPLATQPRKSRFF